MGVIRYWRASFARNPQGVPIVDGTVLVLPFLQSLLEQADVQGNPPRSLNDPAWSGAFLDPLAIAA